MTIHFECGNCGKELSTSEDKAGKTGRCPDCGEPVTVPQPAGETDNPFAFRDEPQPALASTRPISTQTCPMCGAESPRDASSCSHCGEEFLHVEQPRGGDHRFSTGHKIEVGLILSTAWDRFSAQMGLSIAGLLIGYFATLGLTYAMIFAVIIAFALAQASIGLAILTGVLVYFAMLVAQVWIGLGMCQFSLTIARGEEPVLTDIFTAGRFIVRGVMCALLIGFLYMLGVFGLALLAGIAEGMGGDIAVGVILVITFLVVFRLIMSIAWTGFVLLDTDAPGVSSVFLSRDLMAGNYLSVLLLYILSTMIIVAGVLALGIGLIIAFPFVMVIYAVTYDHLSGGAYRRPGDDF